MKSPVLTDFAENVYIPSRIEVSQGYAVNILSVARRFSEHMGHQTRLHDLTEENISSYLVAYKKGHSARSANNQRAILLTLWTFAYDLGFANRPPRRRLIRRLQEETDPPEAWSMGQVNSLLSVAAKWPGKVGNVPAGDWWLSLLLSIYWTSCRIGSMMAVAPSDLSDGGLLVRKQKNHRPQWFALPESCRNVIERTRPERRRLIWEHPWCKWTIWTKFRAIVEAAGLPAPKGKRNLFHKLRRSTITLCAAVDPAVAQRTAGHQDYTTTQRHYIDPRLLRSKSAMDVLPEPVYKTA